MNRETPFLSNIQKIKAPSPLRCAGALQIIVERFDAEGNPFQLPSRIGGSVPSLDLSPPLPPPPQPGCPAGDPGVGLLPRLARQTLLDACLQFFPDAQRAQSQGVETDPKFFRDALAQINLRAFVRGVILLDHLPRMR